MNRPLISVIIPLYNCERYIEECIESISNQSLVDQIEVIIIDDGSTDDSFKTASNYLKKYNIQGMILKQQNRGVSAARNAGIESAKGEFITFVDADDTVISDCMELLYDLAMERRSDMVYGGVREVNAELKEVKKYNKNYFEGSGIETAIEFLKRDIWIRLGAFIISTDLINDKNIRFSEGCKYGEDQEFILKCIVHCNSVGTVAKTIYNYRQYDSSAMRKVSLEQFDFIEAMKRVSNYLNEQFPNELEMQIKMKEYILFSYMLAIKVLASLDIGYPTLKQYIEEKKYNNMFKSKNIKSKSMSKLFMKLFLWETNSYLFYKLIRANYIVRQPIKKLVNLIS